MDSIVAQIDFERGWEKLFREIKLKAAGYNIPYKSARLAENKNRNRYRDVSPFDHSRVRLEDGDNDYINASLVEVPAANRKYILAQGPLSHTSGHFWQMVWEQKSAAVIMLNRIIEKGAIKCSQYFPLDENPLHFADAGFSVSAKRQQVTANYTVRYLELCKTETEEVKEILQFHYTTWPDFGVPDSPAAFLDFLNCVRDSGVLEPNVGPPVIHCSAGIGRSGTFALVDSCLVFIEQDIPFDVKETLLEMRKYRMGLIQTAHQLRFSYMAIAEGARSMRDTEPGNASTETSESEPSPYESSEEEHDSEDDAGRNGDGKTQPDDDQDAEASRKRPAEDVVEDDPTEEKRGKQEDALHVEETVQTSNHEGPEVKLVEESNNNTAELRKRIISERNEALRNHVNDIKSKMKESEQKNNSSWRPYVFGGILLTITVGCAAAYYAYH